MAAACISSRPALDGGPIVAQAAVPVQAGDDEASLAARVLAEEHRFIRASHAGSSKVGWLCATAAPASPARRR
jgi:phosphoribosylglycinamide formyltransferase-1